MDDQQAIIDFLSKPSSCGPAIERVDIIETHVSLVFLAGHRAYKLKRAVKYPYLDFSTAEHRRRACEAELALNRRSAPTLYLEVRALVRMSDGTTAFAGEGPAIDWIVVMRRFDQAMVSDALAKAVARLIVPIRCAAPSLTAGTWRWMRRIAAFSSAKPIETGTW
jgi:aminoglycoside phosphotransferase family enzyme